MTQELIELADAYAKAHTAVYKDEPCKEGKGIASARQALLDALEAQGREIEALKLQAQVWKFEANAQKATVHEIYQLCTGCTGEPGDWNGAEPVRKLVSERDTLQARLDAMGGKEEDCGATGVCVRSGLAAPVATQPVNAGLVAYDKVDRFLRNNLGDDDYAEYSEALDAIATPPVNAELVRALERIAESKLCPVGSPTLMVEQIQQLARTALANAKAAQQNGGA